jgi:hypothetical protein
LTQEGSDYLESLVIKEHVISWKQLSDPIYEELVNRNEGEESINECKVILDKVESVTKEVFLSLIYVLYNRLNENSHRY